MARIRKVTSITMGPETQFIVAELERQAVKRREGFNLSVYVEGLIQYANGDILRRYPG